MARSTSGPNLLAACARAAHPGGRLHVIGLIGPGGVHAHDRHIVALARLAAAQGVPEVRVHALLDGRDTPPRSADAYVADLERRLVAVHPDARIATVGGRYYAMDRDHRWERTALGYQAIVHGAGERAPSAAAAVEAGYARGENDEFVTPTIVDGVDGRVRDGDPIVHANFRADRARQLTHALADADFDGFDRSGPDGRPAPRDLFVVTMTAYEADLPVEVAFGPEEVPSLAGALSQAGWHQVHIAETEKYAHVTYFFNGGREAAWPGEDRILVPSPKVATYDLQPEMSATGVTDALVSAIAAGDADFIVANYANPDMVGHTGVWTATLRALETIDACLGRVVTAVEAVGGRRSGGGRCRPPRDRRPRQRRRAARRRRRTRHGPLAQPRSDRGRRTGGRRPSPPRRRPRRRHADDPGAGRPARLAGRRRALPAGACATIRPPFKSEVRTSVNPLFAIGQIVVGIALMISILLQARGTGLSGAFGGDNAVYRSRRGVERRLWQFTIVLTVLFVLFSLASYALATPAATA